MDNNASGVVVMPGLKHTAVKATREGLLGKVTASGYVIDRNVPYVALPAVQSLYHFVKVTVRATGKWCYAVVLDVGPWNEYDNDYVFGAARPMAESGVDYRGRQTNRAGIDLGERVWNTLRLSDNCFVDWEFI